MDITVAFFTAALLLLAWLFVVYTAWKNTAEHTATDYLYLGLAFWPVLLVDSAVRISGIADWYGIAGVFHFVPIIVAVTLLHHLQKKMQPLYAVPTWISGLVVVASIVAEIPMLLQKVNVGDWINRTPAGNPLELWLVYLPYIVVGCCLMITSSQIIEVCRRYHRYLPWQAVDIRRYEAKLLLVLAYVLLVAAVMSMATVALAAAQLYVLPQWPLVIDMGLGSILLLFLWVTIQSNQIQSSPLDYSRIYSATATKQTTDEGLVSRAQQVMIATKGYKTIGLTLSEFAAKAGVDPTELLIALRRQKKQDFRGFIFHYRMEYARNVVMRTDASIAKVAKRLGFHSEKFLSGAFLSYLEKRK